ncbi:MAG: archaellin/type IV pilin N-terminal domain-containing protein [Candidatus Nanosalina sp.]
MKPLGQKKGITPVIAIVLLLMVTVGAVGVVYTQFQSLVGNPGEEVNKQQRNQQTSLRIVRVESNVTNLKTNGNYNITNYGQTNLTIQNTGSVTRNSSVFLLTSPSGHDIGKFANTSELCFNPNGSEFIDPREVYECKTGILWPRVQEEMILQVELQGSSKNWRIQCRPRTTGDRICTG